MLLVSHTAPRQKKGVWDEEKGGGRSVCERGNSGRRLERKGAERGSEWMGPRKRNVRASGFAWKMLVVQSIKDIEPTTPQMTCGPKVKKNGEVCCPAAISFYSL